MTHTEQRVLDAVRAWRCNLDVRLATHEGCALWDLAGLMLAERGYAVDLTARVPSVGETRLRDLVREWLAACEHANRLLLGWRAGANGVETYLAARRQAFITEEAVRKAIA